MALRDSWKSLQNGSDIRGIALEGIENQHINLTPEIAGNISEAFVYWLSAKKNKTPDKLTIAIGNDSRLTGQALRERAIKDMTSTGANVVNCALCSTPAMFMTTVLEGYEYDGSIMLTASHLPYNRNGLKFFTKDGGLEKQDITEVLTIAQDVADKKHDCAFCSAESICGIIKDVDFISVYASDIVKKIIKATGKEKPLAGQHIIVDAGNGAGGFFAHKVLEPLGACTDGSQFLEPDGHFPNHIPNPEDATAMDSIQQAVIANKADFGIIFDTDVDRAGAVDKNGKEINRNRIIALIAAIAIHEHPGSTIVTDSITSRGLKKFIEELGGVHHRFKRGYKNVINEAIRLNKEGIYTPVAMETSGHGALMENYFLDDGAYLISKILVKMAELKDKNETVDELIASLEEPEEAKEFRMAIADSDFKTYGNDIIDKLKAYSENETGWTVETPNFEGIRVACDKTHGDGWFLLRLSLHEPLMPLNIESDSAGGVKSIAKELVSFLSSFDLLDIGSLKKYVG